MMRAIAIPFVGRQTPAVTPFTTQLRRALLAVLDRLVPLHDPTREPDPPPEWYRFPPF